MPVASPDDYTNIVMAAREKLLDDVELEAIIRFMRDSGLSKMKCMLALEEITAYSGSEIEKIVHTSQTWADVRDEHERFHAGLAEYLERKSDTSPES